ncbi:MAG TPA: hypothetical protein VN853_15350 [Polyangia bacterium]|nr:hypothetical protein [Polyangia bacterium]
MSNARWTRWLRAVFVAPMLVFALSTSSHFALRCALTGLLMPDCCPEADATTSQPAPQASIGEPGCCERTVVATSKLPATGPATRCPAPIFAVARLDAASAGDIGAAFEARDARTKPTRGPARSFPPRYLLACSFLI